MNGKRARWSGSDLTGHVKSYEAVDGSIVTLPVRRPPSGEVPVWNARDVPWAVETFETFWKEAFERPVTPEALIRLEARLADARSRGLDTAEGFASALNKAETPAQFWNVIEAPFGFWGPRIDRLPEDRQARLAALIMAYPPDRRLALMALRLWPRTEARKWEALYRPVVDYFTKDYADLRAFEVGLPKITDVDAMTPELRERIAAEFDRLDGSFGAFVRHARNADPEKASWTPHEGEPVDLSKGERALLTTQSVLKAMRKVKPGIPEGHLMEVALSPKPYGPGWPNVRWEDFRRETIWPYIAEHLDILEIGLGHRAQLPWQPPLSRMKALKTLAFLPKLPARIVAALEDLTKRGTKPQKEAAAALLNGSGA